MKRSHGASREAERRLGSTHVLPSGKKELGVRLGAMADVERVTWAWVNTVYKRRGLAAVFLAYSHDLGVIGRETTAREYAVQ